jgi:hypothetical protein
MQQLLRISPAAVGILLGGALLLGNRGLAQTFLLGFEEKFNFACGQPGSNRTTFHCTLSGSDGNSGAQGWAIGVRAPGRRILSTTVAGTAAETALSRGFVLNELTTGDGNDGAVSFVAFSFGEELGLPPGGPHRILAVDIESSLGDQVELGYVDGLRSSAGTASNIVHVGARGFLPAREGGTFTVSRSPHFGFSTRSVDSSALFDAIVGGEAANGTVEVSGPPGGKPSTHVYPSFISEAAGADGGIQGWAISLGLEGDAQITLATTQGTTVERLFSSGFAKTQIIDPTRNNGGRGVISAIVLSFTVPVTLPQVGTYSVLDLRLESDLSQCAQECTAKLAIKDFLRGAGQPVQTLVTIAGQSVRLCNTGTAGITVRFIGAKEAFLRGNANSDARVDLADVLFVLAELFTGGPPSACRSAEDVSGDGRVDISDAIFLFQFLFRGGRPPALPFPACSLSPADDPSQLGCLESQAICG